MGINKLSSISKLNILTFGISRNIAMHDVAMAAAILGTK